MHLPSLHFRHMIHSNVCASGTRINKDTMEEQKEEAVMTEDVLVTPKAVSAFIRGMKGDSSVVKYKITATPGCVYHHYSVLCNFRLCQTSSVIPV